MQDPTRTGVEPTTIVLIALQLSRISPFTSFGDLPRQVAAAWPWPRRQSKLRDSGSVRFDAIQVDVGLVRSLQVPLTAYLPPGSLSLLLGADPAALQHATSDAGMPFS
jgi:hypothetical protein